MPGSGWVITGQLANQIRNTPTSGTVEGTYIYFVTGDSNAGVVFVPDAVYPHKKRVREMIHAQATLMDEIGAFEDPFTE